MKILAGVPKPLIIFAIVFLILWAVLSGENNPTWDAAYYYSYTRSTVFDGDLKIDNDLLLSYTTASSDFVNKGFEQEVTETGRIASPFALGSSLIWLPWFFTLKAVTAVGQWINVLPDYLSGYEWYFILPTAALSALLGLLAFWFGYLIAFPETGKKSALAAVLTLLFATPLIYYQFREPIYTHATSAFINGLVVYLWWRSYRKKPSYGQALLLGGVIGLAALVRWQNLIYLVIPSLTAVWWWFDLPPAERRLEWKRPIFYAALIAMFALAVLTIQLSHWRVLYGSWITVPQGNAYVDWQAPFWKQVLLSPFRGLLPWMPVALLSIFGLLLMVRKNSRLAIPLLILLVTTMYVNSSIRDWFGGGGYGPRRFTSELVIFIIGYSGLIKAIPIRARTPVAAVIGIALFLHQWILLRFGLAESLGGRVVSMYPEYAWSEESYRRFGQSLTGHLGDFVNNPRDTFIFDGSPLAILLEGRWPGEQINALLLTLFFMLLIWLAYRFIKGRDFILKGRYWVLTIAVLVMILFTNIWIIFWS